MSELRECPFCGSEDLVFCYIRDGLNISCSDCSCSKHKYIGKYDLRTELTKAWKTALKASGIDHCRIHDLRHTCATWLIMKGTSFERVAPFWENAQR